MTRLSPPEGNTTICTIVYHFSKAVHFVLRPRLPPALEMADLLIKYVFRLHGYWFRLWSPFSSHVWRAFHQSLGAPASLSSDQWPNKTKLPGPLSRNAVYHHPTPHFLAHPLPWVKNKDNSQLFHHHDPFMATMCFQPTLFPAQKSEVAVRPVQCHLWWCYGVWHKSRLTLNSCMESVYI